MSTFLNPKTCGFAKAAAIHTAKQSKLLKRETNEGSAKFGARIHQEHYKLFQAVFSSQIEKYDMPYSEFLKKYRKLYEHVSKWGHSGTKTHERKEYFEKFSPESWASLSDARKREHELFDCKGCHQNYSRIQSLFPVKSPLMKKKAQENPFSQAKMQILKKPSKAYIRETTKQLYDQLNPAFESVCGMTFGEALTKIPGTNLQIKESNNVKKNIRRDILRKNKENIENKWKETSVERCLGSRQSFAARERERLSTCFETKQEAKSRTEKLIKEEKKKSPVGDLNKMTWDKIGLKEEVDGYPDGTQINWSDIARRYQITNKAGQIARNGGQIAQEYLINEGVNIHRFKQFHKDSDKKRVRRKKLRGMGGEISIPVPETNKQLTEVLKSKIRNGEYSVGEIIVPKKYEKLVIDKEGKIIKKEFTVEGRKYPLQEIRKKMLEKHRKYMRCENDDYYKNLTRLEVTQRLEELGELHDDQNLTIMQEQLKIFERTRNLIIWHDHSTIANHGHLVFMVAAIYDPALYLTNRAYQELTGFAVDIQTEVEKPEVYIIARCGGTDTEQLAYTETRCECLQDLDSKLEFNNGVQISDEMRFFKGDGPAVAFEVGQQKGGHYFCSGCGMHFTMSNEPENFFRCPYVSIADRQKVVLKGPEGRARSLNKKPKPFVGLSKDQIKSELRGRSLLFNETSNKDVYEKELTAELKGVQRVPALLFLNPTTDLKDLNLQSYEQLACEPMHDLSNHITNILEEIPSHLNKEQKSLFANLMELTLGGKEIKRAADNRAAIVIFAQQLRGHISQELQLLLDTLVEMQAILYKNDDHRSPRLVLRYHNCSFLHFLMCDTVFGSTPTALTFRKFYGKYLHNLVSHAPIQLRLISGASCNAENEERMFSTMKSITLSTSSNRPEHIIGNVFLRIQAEQKIGNFETSLTDTQTSSKLTAATFKLPNTVFTKDFISNKKYSRWYQAHLENISDYLLAGKGIWWKSDDEGSVEFFDSHSEPEKRAEGPRLHHFRSSSFTQEQSYLSSCWNNCLQLKTPIPAHWIYVTNKSGGIDRLPASLCQEPDTAPITVQLPEASNKPFENEACIYTHEEEEEEEEEEKDEEVICMTEVDESHDIAPAAISTLCTNSSSSDTTQPQQPQPQPLKTRLAKTAQFVLGTTEEVKRFDSARHALKQNPNQPFLVSNYNTALACISAKVLAAKSILKKQLRDWEKENFIDTDFHMVTYDQLKENPDTSACLKKLKYAEALLKEWKIHM